MNSLAQTPGKPAAQRNPLTAATGALCATAAMYLAACGGGGQSETPAAPPVTPPATVNVHGVAAVGAPLIGAAVSARCTGGASVANTNTDGTGVWSFDLVPGALPCAFEISGGTAAGAAYAGRLHSYAAQAGVVNITPLTDLLVGVAANASPTTWYAGLDATHAPAIESAVAAATTRVLAALTSAGYTLPTASGFDPRTSAFAATAGNAYDGLLDAFARSLAASGQTYPQLLSTVVANAGQGNLLSIPTFGVGTPPAQPPAGATGEPITLVPAATIGAAQLAPLAGNYTAALGSTTTPAGMRTVSANCSIQARADGTLSVTAGGRTIAALANGDVGDLILGVNGTIIKAAAFDFNGNRNVTIEVVRGYVVSGVATDAEGEVRCQRPNPHMATIGTALNGVLNGATAADLAPSFVGNYSNGTCTVSISANGVLRVVSGAADITGQLGGDEGDNIIVLASIGFAGLTASETTADGRQTLIEFSKGNGNLFDVRAYVDFPRPVQTLANCPNLAKQ